MKYIIYRCGYYVPLSLPERQIMSKKVPTSTNIPTKRRNSKFINLLGVSKNLGSVGKKLPTAPGAFCYISQWELPFVGFLSNKNSKSNENMTIRKTRTLLWLDENNVLQIAKLRIRAIMNGFFIKDSNTFCFVILSSRQNEIFAIIPDKNFF